MAAGECSPDTEAEARSSDTWAAERSSGIGRIARGFLSAPAERAAFSASDSCFDEIAFSYSPYQASMTSTCRSFIAASAVSWLSCVTQAQRFPITWTGISGLYVLISTAFDRTQMPVHTPMR